MTSWLNRLKELIHEPCSDAPLSMSEVRDAARRLLNGEITERAFVDWVQCHVGHDGPEGLQEIVEMDDEYEPNLDATASDRFIEDGMPAQVRAFAEALLPGSEY